MENDWQEVFGLLDQALDLPPSEHEAWLDGLSGPSAAKRPLLERLLAEDARLETSDFLAAPVSLDGRATQFERAIGGRAASGSDAARLGTDAGAGDLDAGTRVGAYRLERELGIGGMGRVWLARRVDGQLDRQVALKLPYSGPFHRELMLRFERERDILAALAHPNIARLYDAGVTDKGQAFLALEYVEGAPLTTFCDSHELPIEARLELFAQVLRAVSYAHACLVIHRDLKPSNILVTGAGEVRLLDFGIAKLMIAGEAKETALTEFAGRALTPDYASPEQIAGLALNTASDVYSLGVLLYELLTGVRPYRLARESRAALEEAILAAEPLRPSLAVRADTGKVRGVPPAKLRRALAGDLDTILLKALKKSPADRYATVDALLQDIERHRRGEPVLARPDSALYRSAKFLKRHRFAAAATAAAAALLIAATLVSLRQARTARDQAVLAQREARRAEAVQNFLLDIFRANTHLQSDPLKARLTTAREMLDIGAARIGDGLHDVPEAQADVMVTLADMYTQMGLDAQAATLRLQRVEALKRAHGPIDLDVAEALLDYVEDISVTRDRNKSMPAIREAGRILDSLGDRDSEVRAEWWMEYGRYYRYTAPQIMRDAEDRAVDLMLAHPVAASWTYPLAVELAALARFELGAYEDADSKYRTTLDIVHQKEPGSSAWEIAPLAQRAGTEAALLKIADAERDFRASLAITETLNGPSHNETLQSAARLGALLHWTSRRAEGAQLLAAASREIERDSGKQGTSVAVLVDTLRGRSLFDEGRFDLAGRFIERAIADAREMYPQSSRLAEALLAGGELYTDTGRHDEARQALTEALAIRRQVGGSAQDAALENPFLLALARLELASADPAAAIGWALKVQAPADAPRRPLLLDDLEARIVVAQAHIAQHRLADAEHEARAVVNALQASPLRGYFQPLEATASLALGSALRSGGDSRTACPFLGRAVQLRTATEDPDSPRLEGARSAAAGCPLPGTKRPG